jgi:hypothetical protein
MGDGARRVQDGRPRHGIDRACARIRATGDARMTVVLVARPVVAGVWRSRRPVLAQSSCGERGTARVSADQRRSKPGRVEVTHPPELRTHVA